MTLSPGGQTALDRLMQAYRMEQASVAAEAALDVRERWRGVEVGNEQSERNFIDLAVQRIEAAYADTGRMAQDFTEQRTGERPEVPAFNAYQTARSMAYVGPVRARQAVFEGEGFQVTPSDAREERLTGVGGSAVRLSALGGRATVVGAASKRVGYVRVTDEDPCSFCAMLAGRRAVYEGDSFELSNRLFIGDGDVKVHDHCSCAIAPVTTLDEGSLSEMDFYERLWDELSGLNRREGESILTTWRRNYRLWKKGEIEIV